MGWKRRVLEVMVDFGMLDGETLAKQQQALSERKAKRPRQFLQLELKPSARQGQPGNVNAVRIHSSPDPSASTLSLEALI